MKKLFTAIFIFILALVFAIAFTYPSITNFTHQYIGDGGDNYEYASYMQLTTNQIHNGIYPLSHTNFWRYPVGINFAYSFDSYITLIIGTALTLLIALPTSYNLTIIILLMLNGIMSYLYFRKIGKSELLGIIGMVLYGFSFYVLARSNAHPNLMFIGGFPLALLFLLRLIEQHVWRMRDILFFFLLCALIALGSTQYIILFGIFVAISLVISYGFYRQQTTIFLQKIVLYKKQTIVAALIALAISLIFFTQHIIALFSGELQVSADRLGTLAFATPGIDDFFLPNKYLHLFISPIATASSKTSIETMVFIGWIEIVFFLLFCFTNRLSKRFRLYAFTLFLIPFLLALGYGTDDSFFLLPYRFLSHITLFDVIAETGRYFVVFYLVFVSAIIIGLRSLANRHLFYILATILLLGAIIERLPLSFRSVPILTNQPYIQVVKNTPAKAVLDLPIDIYTPVYNILSLGYNKPIVNGYFHWLSDGPKQKSFLQNNQLLQDYSCSTADPVLQNPLTYPFEDQEDQQLLQTLKQNGITTIVLHKNTDYLFPQCKNIRIRLNHLIPFEQPLQPTTQQVQYTHSLETGQPNFTFFFPYDGTFYLDGVYISTRGSGNFKILENYQKPEFNYSWSIHKSQNYITLSPQDMIKFKVKGGTHLTIYSSDLIDYTYLSLWYHYVADPNSQKVAFDPTIQRIYEDKNTIVYTIRTN